MAGTTNNVNNVPIASPVPITSPILKRLTAPAPVAVINGITPNTIAAVVIKMGLKRMPEASVTRFLAGAKGRERTPF